MKFGILGLIISAAVFAPSPRIVLADSGKMFLCEKPGEDPIYVAPDNIRSYRGGPDENGYKWDCRPAPAP